MKVLLIGATGNLGLRLTAALITHKHNVVTFVRSASKLESLLPQSVFSQLTVVQGNATDSAAIKKAILDNNCDAVVNTAGLAAMAPWKSSDLPAIFKSVVTATQDAGAERSKPLRAWFMAGLGILHFPGTQTMLSNYIPIYLEHRQDLALLESLPPNAIDWSMLCPSEMMPQSSTIIFPATPDKKLIANATTPPQWQHSWVEYIPVLGKVVSSVMNAGRYGTNLEQNAELIASDLETYESRWSGKTVGVLSP